jgi:hypothetical protein
VQVVRSAQSATAAVEGAAADMLHGTAVLDAAQQAIDAGDLPTALETLRNGGLPGLAAAATEDWCRAAASRVEVDQAIAVVRGRAAVLAVSVW